MIFLLPRFYPDRSSFGFPHLLYATAFGFDVTYTLLLTRARIGGAAPASR